MSGARRGTPRAPSEMLQGTVDILVLRAPDWLVAVYESPAAAFGAVALARLAVVLLSCAMPAARATRVDPITSVRAE